MLEPNFEKADGLGITYFQSFKQKFRILMPSPSAFSKFGSSILKFFKHAQFFVYTQNNFGILKS